MNEQENIGTKDESLTVRKRAGKGTTYSLEMTIKITGKEFELPEILARIGCFPTLEEYFYQGLTELRVKIMKDAKDAVSRCKANGQTS